MGRCPRVVGVFCPERQHVARLWERDPLPGAILVEKRGAASAKSPRDCGGNRSYSLDASVERLHLAPPVSAVEMQQCRRVGPRDAPDVFRASPVQIAAGLMKTGFAREPSAAPPSTLRNSAVSLETAARYDEGPMLLHRVSKACFVVAVLVLAFGCGGAHRADAIATRPSDSEPIASHGSGQRDRGAPASESSPPAGAATRAPNNAGQKQVPDSDAAGSAAPSVFRPGVLIPAGSYSLSEGRGKVALEAFYVDLHEATVHEYAECVRAGKCTHQGLGSRPRCNWGRADRQSHPINCVSADQARSFCSWVGERMLTEDEWEAAALLDGYPRILIEYGMKHSAGPGFPNVCYNKESSTRDPGGDAYGTCPIGQSILGSKLGLQDMVGNVSEWTEASCIGRDQTDPYQRCSEPVLRGSAWEGDVYRRVSDRAEGHLRRDHIKGIRCGRTALSQ